MEKPIEDALSYQFSTLDVQAYRTAPTDWSDDDLDYEAGALALHLREKLSSGSWSVLASELRRASTDPASDVVRLLERQTQAAWSAPDTWSGCSRFLERVADLVERVPAPREPDGRVDPELEVAATAIGLAFPAGELPTSAGLEGWLGEHADERVRQIVASLRRDLDAQGQMRLQESLRHVAQERAHPFHQRLSHASNYYWTAFDESWDACRSIVRALADALGATSGADPAS